jgi:hypothetical protein
MGASASRAAIAAENAGDLRLTLKELEAAAREKRLSPWWLESGRIKQLYQIFDTDKNGQLDATECARAIRELARLGDHFFGVHVDPHTAQQLDDFAAALERLDKASGGGAEAAATAAAAAVPLEARATEIQAVLGARARLETRSALVATQLAALRDATRSGTQSARGLEKLHELARPLEQAQQAASAALPRLERKFFRQHNAASCLLWPQLCAAADSHDALYHTIASREAAHLAAVCDTVRALDMISALITAATSADCHPIAT